MGLSTSGAANPQLACIANATGGLFVTASDTSALIRRLQFAQYVDRAGSTLSTTGLGGAQLGASYADVAAQNSDFPAWTSATSYNGTLPGIGNVLVEIIWQDCSYLFNQADQTLEAIIPNRDPTTVDGITIGNTASHVAAIYGDRPCADRLHAWPLGLLLQPAQRTGFACGTRYPALGASRGAGDRQ